MNRLFRIFLAAVATACAVSAHAQSCTGASLSPGQDVVGAIEAAAPGAVICLNQGTYTPVGNHFAANIGTFAIGNNVTLRGAPGLTPSQVVLQGGAGASYAVFVVGYIAGKSPAGATIQNLTIAGSQGGIQLFN
ncbi:MAG TPA: hypothetical protein VFJ62_18700, partial [Usitatibacter sp.]|nr:hypothetical protein [Usitatibacter sp.]